MAETIAPALTPEEWARYEGLYYHDIWSDLIHDPRDLSNPHRYQSPKLHAAAALALNGQPFGFTREDVDLLRSGNTEEPDTCRAFDRLAAKIAALPPPED